LLAPDGIALAKSKSKNTWQNGRSFWPICLDTATLDKKLGIEKKVELAAEAGFDCIEPWDRELADFEKKGGSLSDLGKHITDLGLYVPSVIGLWNALDVSKEALINVWMSIETVCAWLLKLAARMCRSFQTLRKRSCLIQKLHPGAMVRFWT
jgi:hypothetical protein